MCCLVRNVLPQVVLVIVLLFMKPDTLSMANEKVGGMRYTLVEGVCDDGGEVEGYGVLPN